MPHGTHFSGIAGGFSLPFPTSPFPKRKPPQHETKENEMNMKTMKLWRIAFVMLAAFSIASFLCVTPQQLSRIRKAVTFSSITE